MHDISSAVTDAYAPEGPEIHLEIVPDRWLAAAPGLALGLFATRLAYECWPASLATLVTWPAGPALALTLAALVVGLYRRLGHSVGLEPFFPWVLLLLYVFQPDVNLLQAGVLLMGVAMLSLLLAAAALGARDWQMRWGARLALLIAGLVMYAPTMGRSVGEADTFEFQVVAPILGVAHPTGYPLYILLGKLFSLLPWGQTTWRVNLTSLTCAIAALILMFGVAEQILGRQAWPRRFYCAAIGALSLAGSAVFWSQALVAEIYALNAVFVALLLGLMVYGLNRRQAEADWPARGWLLAVSFLYGLSLTNHLTMALLLPGLALALVGVRPRITWGDGLKAVGLFGVGLSVYIYILVRWPALHGGQAMPLGDFVAWVTGRQFAGALQWGLWQDATRWRILGRLLLEAYGPVGAGLAIWGAVALGLRRWRVLALLAVTFVAYSAYGLVYNVPDVSVFLIPAYMLLAVCLAAGLFFLPGFDRLDPDPFEPVGRSGAPSPLSSRFGAPLNRQPYSQQANLEQSRRVGDSSRPAGLRQVGGTSLIAVVWRSLPHLVLLGALLLPLSLVWTNWSRVDQSQRGRAMVEWGQYVLSLPLPRRSVILADSEKIAPLYYLKRVEGVRGDLDILVMGSEELYRAEVDRRMAQSQPLYLARFLPGLAGVYHLYSVGPLVRVAKSPLTSLPMAPITRYTDVSFGDGLVKLLGYDLTRAVSSPAADAAGAARDASAGVYRLTVYWQALKDIPDNYHVRLRLVSEAGTTWWEDSGTHPVNGYNPTAAWQPGEVVADYHEAPIDTTFPPGRYRLEVGLFAPFSDNGLRLDASTGDVWYNLAWVDVNPSLAAGQAWPALPTVRRANFGGQVLLRGVSQPGLLPPAGRGELILEWEKLPSSGLADSVDYAQLTLARADGVPVRTLQVKPYAGEYPVSRWLPGGRLRMPVRFSAPDQPGVYTLRLGWVDHSGRWVAARCAWMGAVDYECPLATLQVEGARREEGVNFADQVILVRAYMERDTLALGDALEVNLRWQGLRGWPDDYTVFVHLIGPDGRLHGQVDAYPVQGTLPTTQWQAGQVVDDPYLVRLSPDAPPGEYQVVAGWYLLSTLRRLSVLDAAGRPVDDHVVIGKVKVLP